MKKVVRSGLSCVLTALLAGVLPAAHGQVVELQEGTIERTEFVVSPAPAPEPLLKYRLLPDPLDLRPGDGASLYLHAAMAMRKVDATQNWRMFDALEAPVSEVEEYSAMLDDPAVQRAFRLLRRANRRRRWTMVPGGLADKGYDTERPQLGNYRELARYGMVRGRLAASRGRYASAVETAGDIHVLGQRLNRGPTPLCGLVGVVCRSLATATVRDIVQQPGAPNLYYALAELPSAYRQMVRPIEHDLNTWFLIFPELRNPEEELATLEQWNESGLSRENVVTPKMLLQLAPEAIGYLTEQQGRPLDEVKAMPVRVSVSLYVKAMIEKVREESVAILNLPYPVAAGRLEDFSYGTGNAELEQMLSVFQGTVPRIAEAAARQDRRRAALMCVEALRMHAAEAGQLPENLDDITAVPVPDDPMAGRPFEYRLEGDVAVLRQATLPESGHEGQQGINYRIRLREQD